MNLSDELLRKELITTHGDVYYDCLRKIYEKYGYSEEQILSGRRSARIVKARQWMAKKLMESCGYAGDVGLLLNRDRTSILYITGMLNTEKRKQYMRDRYWKRKLKNATN